MGASSCQSCRIQHSVPALRFPAPQEASAYAAPRTARPLPPASHHLQVKSGCATCDKATRRANHPHPVQSFVQKYSAFAVGQITDLNSPVSPDERGVAHVTNAGKMRWTRKLRLTSVADADGEVVWSWRRDAGVKPAGGIPPATVARKPVHRGEREISRKTIAQGKPGCLRWTCMLVCAFFCATCTRDRGCSAHPAFPAPSLFEGREINASLGRSAPRDCEHTSGVIARLDRATQYSRDVSDTTEKPQRTGSPAFAGDDNFVCGRLRIQPRRRIKLSPIRPTRYQISRYAPWRINHERKSLLRGSGRGR